MEIELIVIPRAMGKEVLKNQHSSHQGLTKQSFSLVSITILKQRYQHGNNASSTNQLKSENL